MDIKVNYAALSSGQEGLLGAWNRIETLLAELDAAVMSSGDMQAQALTAYRELKARWSAGAQERQQALRALSDYLGGARDHYQQVDLSIAAMFA